MNALHVVSRSHENVKRSLSHSLSQRLFIRRKIWTETSRQWERRRNLFQETQSEPQTITLLHQHVFFSHMCFPLVAGVGFENKKKKMPCECLCFNFFFSSFEKIISRARVSDCEHRKLSVLVFVNGMKYFMRLSQRLTQFHKKMNFRFLKFKKISFLLKKNTILSHSEQKFLSRLKKHFPSLHEWKVELKKVD